MPHHARHRRPSDHTPARTALTLAFTGATAALPVLGTGQAAQAAAPAAAPGAATGTARAGAAAAKPAQPEVHVVRPGESLAGIAETLHVPGGWRALYADNRATVGANPALIRPGERLRIPVAAPSAAAKAKTAPAPAPKSVVKPAPAPVRAPAPTTATQAGSVTPRTAEPQGVSGSWTPVFDDEFTGDSLSTANWGTGWLAPGVTSPVSPYERECYDPAQVSVGGGYLHLDAAPHTEECGGETRPYASGMVTTAGLHQFGDGFYEARVYLPAAPDGGVADWPAFWTDGQSWPADGEMDVMEGLSGRTCYYFHSPAPTSGGCADTGPGWHTFGADRENGRVTYYYDGREVGSTGTGGADAPQFLVLDNAVGWAGGETAPADMLVDYVRVWKRG